MVGRPQRERFEQKKRVRPPYIKVVKRSWDPMSGEKRVALESRDGKRSETLATVTRSLLTASDEGKTGGVCQKSKSGDRPENAPGRSHPLEGEKERGSRVRTIKKRPQKKKTTQWKGNKIREGTDVRRQWLGRRSECGRGTEGKGQKTIPVVFLWELMLCRSTTPSGRRKALRPAETAVVGRNSTQRKKS